MVVETNHPDSHSQSPPVDNNINSDHLNLHHLPPNTPPEQPPSSASSSGASSNSLPGTPSATPNSNDEPCREPSQTDRLNFRLLASFLERINNGAFALPPHQPPSDDEGAGDPPAPRDPGLLQDAEALMKDAATAQGLLMRHPQVPDGLKTVPVTLFPTVLDRGMLEEVRGIQGSINALMHRVALDRGFIEGALAGAASVDPFIANLLEIYRQVDVEKQWQLGLFRSDYLEHAPDSEENGTAGDGNNSKHPAPARFKQVEVNTICVGLSGIGSRLAPCHSRILNFLQPAFQPDFPVSDSESLHLYGEALALGHSVYCRQHPAPHTRVLLFVIHKGFEFNIMDQRLVEFASGLPTLRRTMESLRSTARVDADGRLWVEGLEVAVVYFRTAYMPDHYDGKVDWDLRLLIEKSEAIKCPSVAYQLAGFKKIQQELSRPEVLSRFLRDDPAACAALLAVNMPQYDLADPSAAPAIADALAHPARYVLKPNREGGGNNFYFQDLVDRIQAVRGTPLAQDYILMAKMQPSTQRNVLIRAQTPPAVVDAVSEVGVFGTVLARGETEMLLNRRADAVLVRSKALGVNEGGLALGWSCLSSAWLV
ncbi:glutathione synthetase-like [Paramacrobiotus metropolitanus]|uniref:glutathione synthetase-like n=1 Tax=Paramacrobiotus metropolitanus TaxID=2943436 RepID=UPI002445FA24|nr:glutathione synthetase-like [Paramacrobiotus metropolitanus]